MWAERAPGSDEPSAQALRVRRHPYAATAIEAAALLDVLVPEGHWRTARRFTRVALLPSTERGPLVPRWLGEEPAPDDAPMAQLLPWRIEGLGLPILTVLELLITLPMDKRQVTRLQRLGDDLRYWGLAAKLGLELLARQRYLPAVHQEDGRLRAVWEPVVDGDADRERFAALVEGMPPACRALFRERADMGLADIPSASSVLESFLLHLVDGAVRTWGGNGAAQAVAARTRLFGRNGAAALADAWWQALITPDDARLQGHGATQADVQRFAQAWQAWSYRPAPEASASFRVCFRLEPPTLGADGDPAGPSEWTLRYLLQATDDPSLLVPARDVWRESGHMLSYLNLRFDRPQEKLLEALGMAGRFAPPIERSLHQETPEAAILSPAEAYTFLRETARLLADAGFGVLVPPWWNRPDARLRARLRLQTQPSSGRLGLDALVRYDWQLALGDQTLTREEFERLAALKTPLVQVRGQWVLLRPDQVEAAVAFWEKQRLQGTLSVGEALHLLLGAEDAIAGLPVDEPELDETLADMLGRLSQPGRYVLLDTPSSLVGQLRPYQVEGLSWLAFLRRTGFGGCLADDMGLGKTIQAIALLLHERAQRPDLPPALVVCPTSVVGNWRRELQRFAPGLRTSVHHGVGRAEGDAFVSRAGASDVVISTYGLVRRDLPDLLRVSWSDIILDEAQNIKNPVTKQARAVRLLQGGGRFALTGTPVENRLTDLWSIMAFLNPGYLGTLEGFRRSLAMPIERFQDGEAADRLRRLVRPFVLRRLKTDPNVIRDLPEKVEYKVYCNLSREQATLYEAVVQEAMRAIQEQSAHQGLRRRGLVLAMLTRLKQVCNHPALYLGDGSALGQRSGKLNRLVEMLEEVLAVGDRALIFTQFAQMGRLLQQHLAETFDTEVFFLHGGTPQHQRDDLVGRFQDDPDAPSLFVLSLRAGGTGLNLMRANQVFHLDRWWTPAVENQATDRAYRIGQARDVHVHKFICAGTLEERIDELIESKRALADAVVGGGESWLAELSTETLRDLVTLRAEEVEDE
ncbi:MAG: DEAD/DEAH box helicase [Chloroflexota bacterium]